MRSRVTLFASIAILAIGALVSMSWRGLAQEAPPAVFYVSGLQIGKRTRASLRVTNSSTVPGDLMRLQYTVFRGDNATERPQPLSLPGAGEGALLWPGETLDLDLGAIVTAYRAAQELSTYEGPIHVVAFGGDGPVTPFGRDSVYVQALQTERKATYRANVEWRPLELVIGPTPE